MLRQRPIDLALQRRIGTFLLSRSGSQIAGRSHVGLSNGRLRARQSTISRILRRRIQVGQVGVILKTDVLEIGDISQDTVGIG